MDHTGGDATLGIPISLPNLKGTIGKADVDKKGQADYVNWAATLQRLRDVAPGWMAEVQENSENGSWLFPSPKGCSVRVRFRHISGFATPWVMQALMDFRNKDVSFSEAGDVAINKAVMRGTCKAAAFHFGLAYELWAEEPIEDVYDPNDSDKAPAEKPAAALAAVPDTQEESPATESAPTKESVIKLLKGHPAKAEISSMFLKQFHPSYEGTLKASHITTDEHILALHDVITGWEAAA